MNSCIHWWIIKRNPDLWFVDNGLQHQQDRLPIRIQSQQSCLRRIFFHKFCLRRILFHQKRHFISVSYSSLVYRFIDIQRDSIQILSDYNNVSTKGFNSNTQWSQRKGSALQGSRRIVDLITTELQALSTPCSGTEHCLRCQSRSQTCHCSALAQCNKWLYGGGHLCTVTSTVTSRSWQRSRGG